MPHSPTGKFSFEELNKEVRSYLAEVSDELGATRALRKIEAAQNKCKSITRTILKSTLDRAAKAGYEIRDGVVREPQPQNGQAESVLSGTLSVDPGDEIRQARSIQSKLLPTKVPKLPGLEVATFSRFCHEVGGDYFDFIPMPNNRVGVVIADVSGKGVPAAMVMVMFRSILRMVAGNEQSAIETMVQTNRLLAPDLLRGMFVSALYAVVDPTGRDMTFVNAGHHPPLIWRPRLSGTRAINLKGPVLGLLDTDRFRESISERTLALEPGDCLCLYTDGVTEAKNLLGDQFGEQGLARAFRAAAGQRVREIVQDLVSAVDAHQDSAPQHDDITILVLKRQANGGSHP